MQFPLLSLFLLDYGDLEIGTWKSVLLHAPLSKASKVAGGWRKKVEGSFSQRVLFVPKIDLNQQPKMERSKNGT